MKSFFSQEAFRDFGPLSLSPGEPTPTLVAAVGKSLSLGKQVGLLAPRKPGVYGMLDEQGVLHYVGKAKNLRIRLQSYFRPASRPSKATRMIRQTRTIVWEVWPREFSALLRELELIRRWRPRFNVVGQPAPFRHGFLCLGRAPAPYLFVTRNVPKTAKASFGPMPMSRKMQEAARLLNDAFQLRDCPQPTDMVFPEQQELFPVVHPVGCLRLDLRTCLAPCTGTCAQRAYAGQVKKARNFLEGKDASVMDALRLEMADAAQTQRFERAAGLRDKLALFEWLVGRLERLEKARGELSVVYPVEGPDNRTWWYVLHAGRPLLAVQAPRERAEAQGMRDTLERIYQRNDHPRLADSYEHHDDTLFVSAWFRKFPLEKKRTLSPAQAMRHCEKICRDKLARRASE